MRAVVIEQQDARRVRLAIIAHVVLATALMGIVAKRFPQFPFALAQAWVMVVATPAVGAWIGLWRAQRSERPSATTRHLLLVPLGLSIAATAAFFELMVQISGR